MRLVGNALLLVAVAGTACSGSSQVVATNEITMTDQHTFDPAVAKVDAGTAITFVNESDEAHTVTAYEDSLPDGAVYFASGGFDSEEEARDDVGGGLIAPGEEFTVTLDEPGTYEYFCIPHEEHGMKGEIQV